MKPIHRQVTFSRTFPATHPKKGEPTYFVEKIWKWIYESNQFNYPLLELLKYQNLYHEHFKLQQTVGFLKFDSKFHTIRKGKRFKVGDFIVPMVWAGRPYHKTADGKWKIQFAPPLELVKVYDFEIKEGSNIYINNVYFPSRKLIYIAQNDGLKLSEFGHWFNIHKGHDFSGQILCWGDISY